MCNLVAQSPGTAKQQFRREVQKELPARETEASELGPDSEINSVQMFNKSLSALATATMLLRFFFAICVGVRLPHPESL